MKKLFITSSVCILALIASAFPVNAQSKVATVDMDKVFKAYYKTKDAENRINEARTAAKKEYDDRMDTYKKNLDAINKLNDEINKPELSKQAKDEKTKARDEKIAETKNLEREITDFRSSREKQLQEQAVRMRNGIVDEITKLVQDRVKSESYDLVFDKSGVSLNGIPMLLVARDSMDFSDDIIKELNKNKPKEGASSAAEKSPAKPAEKKK